MALRICNLVRTSGEVKKGVILDIIFAFLASSRNDSTRLETESICYTYGFYTNLVVPKIIHVCTVLIGIKFKQLLDPPINNNASIGFRLIQKCSNAIYKYVCCHINMYLHMLELPIFLLQLKLV